MPRNAAIEAVLDEVSAMARTPAWKHPITPGATDGAQAPGVMGELGAGTDGRVSRRVANLAYGEPLPGFTTDWLRHQRPSSGALDYSFLLVEDPASHST